MDSITSSYQTNPLISAKWLNKNKHRLLLENTASQLCSLEAFLPSNCPRSQRPNYTLLAVQLEGKETQLLIKTKNLCHLLGIEPSSLTGKDPKELGTLLASKANYLNALDQAAHFLQTKTTLSNSKRQTILKQTAQKVSQVAETEFKDASILPYTDGGEVEFWANKLSKKIGIGSLAAAFTVKTLGEEESSNIALKLIHSLSSFKKKIAAEESKNVNLKIIEEKALKRLSFAENQLKNEFNLLGELHKEKILEGVQLPPHEIVALDVDNEKQIGYLGVRYDSDLTGDRSAYATPEIALQLLSGLNSISAKVSHGDIKPRNILVRKNPSLRADISDFGGALTKEDLKRIWVKGIQKINSVRYESYDVIREAEEDLIEALDQFYTPAYTPREAPDNELEAIRARNFEDFFAIRQRSDLFALGKSLKILFKGYEDRLTSQQLNVIEKMSNDNYYIRHYTIQNALQDWNLPEQKNLVQIIIDFFR